MYSHYAMCEPCYYHFISSDVSSFENLLRVFLIASRYVSRPPQLRGPVASCLEESCKWRQALASHTHPHARSRHAHAHRAFCHALRRPPAQCRSPACRRCRYMSPPWTVARIKTCSDARLQHATGGARTRASPPVSSPRRPPSWWSTQERCKRT